MAQTKRTPIQRERDLLEISGLYLRGITQAEIASQLGVSQQQVSYDLKILQRRWLAESVAKIDERKARELAKVDRLEREYWEAWERSKLDAETVTLEKLGALKDGQGQIVGTKVKEVKKREGQSGNPSFLAGVQWCIDKRCEILGLDAPKKIDATSKGEQIGNVDTDAIVSKLLPELTARNAQEPPGKAE